MKCLQQGVGWDWVGTAWHSIVLQQHPSTNLNLTQTLLPWCKLQYWPSSCPDIDVGANIFSSAMTKQVYLRGAPQTFHDCIHRSSTLHSSAQ
jgi:hypothetical protein